MNKLVEKRWIKHRVQKSNKSAASSISSRLIALFLITFLHSTASLLSNVESSLQHNGRSHLWWSFVLFSEKPDDKRCVSILRAFHMHYFHTAACRPFRSDAINDAIPSAGEKQKGTYVWISMNKIAAAVDCSIFQAAAFPASRSSAGGERVKKRRRRRVSQRVQMHIVARPAWWLWPNITPSSLSTHPPTNLLQNTLFLIYV